MPHLLCQGLFFFFPFNSLLSPEVLITHAAITMNREFNHIWVTVDYIFNQGDVACPRSAILSELRGAQMGVCLCCLSLRLGDSIDDGLIPVCLHVHLRMPRIWTEKTQTSQSVLSRRCWSGSPWGSCGSVPPGTWCRSAGGHKWTRNTCPSSTSANR